MRLRLLVASLVLFVGVLSTPAHAALDAKALDQSLALGRQFLMNCQRPDGSFIHEMDAASGKDLGTRYATREMGGLWALAVLHRHTPTKQSANAVLKSLNYFGGQARRTPTGERYLCEPTAKEGATSTMATHVLAMIDFLAADYELDPAVRTTHERNLGDSIKFLLTMRRPGGLFFPTYRCADGRGTGTPSPDSDGASLLALVRAAKQDGDEALRDVVLESAGVMYGEYVKTALRANPNSEPATAFYPWGANAFYELYTSGWTGTQPYAARVIVMARWMIDVRHVVERGTSAGHALQGLAVAWELARLTNDRKNQLYLAVAIEKALSNAMNSQIGLRSSSATIPATFLVAKNVRGGVLSKESDPRLRIDVSQHQVQTTLFVRRLMFKPAEAAKK
jgi:hypothetical protein